jgi:hypothetical protein
MGGYLGIVLCGGGRWIVEKVQFGTFLVVQLSLCEKKSSTLCEPGPNCASLRA